MNDPADLPHGDGLIPRALDSKHLGALEPLNVLWDPETQTLSLRLVSGQLGSAASATQITAGLRRPEDGALIAGDLAEILRVITRAPKAQAGTRTRGDAPLDPQTGILTLKGDSLVLTPEGLGHLEALLTSGGNPRTEFDRDAQDGKVPAALDVLSRIATWRADGHDKGWAMPLRVELLGEGWTSAVRGGTLGDAGDGSTVARAPKKPGAGSFSYDAGPPARLVQTFPSGERQVIREGGNFQGAALAALMTGLANKQATVIAELEALRARGGSQLAPFDAARLRLLESDLQRLNEGLASQGANVSNEAGGAQMPEPGSEADRRRGCSVDATPAIDSFNTAHVWGTLKAYDIAARRDLDPDLRGKDTEKYRGYGRFAPYFCIDLDKIIKPPYRDPPPPEDGDPPPPPPEDGDPPPFPPPPPPGQKRIITVPPNRDPQTAYIIAMPPVAAAPEADSYVSGEGNLISSPHPVSQDTDADDAADADDGSPDFDPHDNPFGTGPPPDTLPPAACPTQEPDPDVPGIDHGPGAGAAGGGAVWDPTGTGGVV